MSAAPAATVADNPQQQRYEIRSGDELAGFVQYRAAASQIELVHTEVEDRFEGQGLASKLIGFALDDARERGLAVLPTCPFVKAHIQRHREYLGLVPEEQRDSFGL
jgi:predicted GNAT family acetyltransferase